MRNIFLKPCLVETLLTGKDVYSKSTIILCSIFQINQQITSPAWQALQKGEGEGGIWAREGEKERNESSPPPSFLGRGPAP